MQAYYYANLNFKKIGCKHTSKFFNCPGLKPWAIEKRLKPLEEK
jgi:hypothetical protein